VLRRSACFGYFALEQLSVSHPRRPTFTTL